MLLTIDSLTKEFRGGGSGSHRAVDGVSFSLEPGEIVSVIGESGSGKTTLGRMILKLTEPTRGTICFDGQDITTIRRTGDRKEYYRRVQGVFQDPFSTFNPIFKADRVFHTLRREFFPGVSPVEWSNRVDEVLRSVGLNPGDVRDKYSYQLSGGQLQRLLVARALLLDVDLLVADEIISMLDASTRIDVLNLLGDLRDRRLSVLFITHDLSLGYYISDTSVILYQGVMVESGSTQEVFSNPLHPYTQRLLQAIPRLDKKWADVELHGPQDIPFPLYEPGIHRGSPGVYSITPQHHVAVAQD